MFIELTQLHPKQLHPKQILRPVRDEFDDDELEIELAEDFEERIRQEEEEEAFITSVEENNSQQLNKILMENSITSENKSDEDILPYKRDSTSEIVDVVAGTPVECEHEEVSFFVYQSNQVYTPPP